MDTAEFKEVFAAEARDYLQSLNENLLELERAPDDRDVLDNMFRAAHSLKGMSGTMGFQTLASLTHHMESALDLLRTGELSAGANVVNALFRSVDTLEVILDQTLLDEETDDITALITLLQSLLDEKGTTEKPVESLATREEESTEEESPDLILDEFNKETVKQGLNQGYSAYQIGVTLKDNTLLKSVRVYTVFQALEAIGTIVKSNPTAQELEEERFDNEFTVFLLTHESAESVSQTIYGISEIEAVTVTSVDHYQLHSSLEEAREESAPTLEKNAVVETVPLAKKEEKKVEKTPVERPQAKARKKESKDKGGQGRFADKFVRVETDRLDKLINLVGELVISRTQVLEMGKGLDSSDHKNTIVQLDRITTDLQYAAMKLRMVPIKEVFDRFPRMVRDLALAKDKDIRLVVSGEETELDRSIVNQIGDPLVHLLRNSVDHGLESREERIAQGKPAEGTIFLEARHEGSHILIEVSDNGQGINVEKIRQKAIAQGMILDDHKSISQDEAIELLFQPGFSTAETVTDISGRGVGMDAVKNSVEALSGSVELESHTGKGTRVTIKLPLTLAIIKALLVSTHKDTYAIPIQAVRENLRVAPEEIKSIQQKEVIVLRNEVLPLFDLAECLGFPRPQYESTLPVIVVETRGEKIGYIVQDLIGQQEIVIKSLSGILGDIHGIAGATVLGNGRVALILDNSTLIKQQGA